MVSNFYLRHTQVSPHEVTGELRLCASDGELALVPMRNSHILSGQAPIIGGANHRAEVKFCFDGARLSVGEGSRYHLRSLSSTLTKFTCSMLLRSWLLSNRSRVAFIASLRLQR